MPFVAIALIGALGIGAAVLAPKLLNALAKQRKLSQCSQIRAALNGARQQGGDQVQAALYEAQYRQCIEEARASGVDIDAGEAELDSCQAAAAQMMAEWAHYGSTGQEDAIKRNNTRASILRAGESMVACLHAAVGKVESIRVLDTVEAFAREQALQSKRRIDAFFCDPTYSRYGLNEPHVNDKATDEMLRVGAPLGVVEMYGVEWAACGNHLVEGTTVDRLRALDAGSVLAAIRAKRAELVAAQSLNVGGLEIQASASAAGALRGVRIG